VLLQTFLSQRRSDEKEAVAWLQYHFGPRHDHRPARKTATIFASATGPSSARDRICFPAMDFLVEARQSLAANHPEDPMRRRTAKAL
jgi:hypothetical protein